MGAFLTADWRDVLAATCAVAVARLEPRRRPPEPRRPRVPAHARAGLAIPGHVTFPEVNLRFYSRHRGERGVVFVRELAAGRP